MDITEKISLIKKQFISFANMRSDMGFINCEIIDTESYNNWKIIFSDERNNYFQIDICDSNNSMNVKSSVLSWVSDFLKICQPVDISFKELLAKKTINNMLNKYNFGKIDFNVLMIPVINLDKKNEFSNSVAIKPCGKIQLNNIFNDISNLNANIKIRTKTYFFNGKIVCSPSIRFIYDKDNFRLNFYDNIDFDEELSIFVNSLDNYLMKKFISAIVDVSGINRDDVLNLDKKTLDTYSCLIKMQRI